MSRALRVPRSQRGVPAEILLGELGLMSFDARASMHTRRVWDAIMARPAAAVPRLAWLELVNACEALTGGPPMYSLVARVKEILQSVAGLRGSRWARAMTAPTQATCAGAPRRS